MNLLKILILTLFEVFKVKEFHLIEVSEWRDYTDDKSSKILGNKYVILTPTYDKLTIKVPDLPPVISQEDIINSTTPVMVSFTGDVLKFYRSNTGEYLPTVKAEKITITKPPKKV